MIRNQIVVLWIFAACVCFLYLLPISFALTNACRSDEFQCSNGTVPCIPKLWQCDGRTDCDDGSDEVNCTCPFQCVSDKKCIPIDWRCDGRSDCSDGSDELNCNCTASGQFKCKTGGQCILSIWKCDSKNDCYDGSDEVNCTCSQSNGFFQCNNSRCIASYLRCNFNNDCGDYSDETWCACDQSDRFQCDNGRCIYSYKKCDLIDNCGDNSDEKGCDKCTNSYQWNTNVWNKCCQTAFGGYCYMSSWGDIRHFSTYGFGWYSIYFSSSSMNQTCSSLSNFSSCLSSVNGLHKCGNTPYDGIDSYYYLFTLRLNFLTYACSIPEGFLKYLRCRENNYNSDVDAFVSYSADTLHLPDTYIVEYYKCFTNITRVDGSNASQCRYYNEENLCLVRTDEKFNQRCGSPSFMYYYYAYSRWTDNIPYAYNYLYGCTLDSAPPDCKVYQRWNYSTCSDIAPVLESPYLAGPTVVSNNRNESWIEFYCQLKNSDAGSNSRFQITFLFEDVEYPNVPRFNISGYDGRATLHEKYLVGHMGTSVSCSVFSFWTTSPETHSRVVNSVNRYWIGIEPVKVRNSYYLSEESWYPAFVYLKSTLPFICSLSSTGCSLNYSILTNTDYVVAYPGCSGEFLTTDWKPSESRAYSQYTTIQLLAIRTPIVSSGWKYSLLRIATPVLPNKIIASESFPNIWSGYTNNVSIARADHASSFCSVSGFLHVQTFDGAQYSTYSCGQFVYVQAKACQPFEVHVRHWPCIKDMANGPCCVCGIAAREGGNIIGVDMCTDSIPHYFTYTRRRLPSGYGIQVSPSGYSFGISLPSGNKIWGDIYGRRMGFQIYSPFDNQNLLEGLCGSFDGNKNNDINVRGSGKYYQLNNLWTDIGPNDYIESWRIPPRKSLFDGYLSTTTGHCDTPLKGGIVCSCLADAVNCSLELIRRNKIQMVPLFTITPRIPFSGGTSPTGRRRREASDFNAIDNIDYGYNSGKYAFANAMTNSTLSINLTWPTRTGITQDQAQNYCYQTLWLNSTFHDACSRALSNSDIQNVVNKCVLDIQITSDLNQAKNLLSEIRNLCVLQTVTKPISTVSSSDTEDTIWQTIQTTLIRIQSVSCSPPDCGGQGTCDNGSCVCTNGNIGYDCGVANDTAPTIQGLVDSSTCDVHNSACLSLQMSTSNVASSSNFVCRISVKKGNSQQTYYTSAALFSQTATSCNLPSDPLNSFSNHFNFASNNPGYPALFYTISISNDNQTFSNNVSIIVFDSLCYDCPTTCSAKVTACLINGYCFDNYQTSPYNPNQGCDIANSTTQWSTAKAAPTTSGVFTGSTTTGTIIQPGTTGGIAASSSNAQPQTTSSGFVGSSLNPQPLTTTSGVVGSSPAAQPLATAPGVVGSSPTATTTTTTTKSSTISTGALVGGIVGGIAGVGLIVAAVAVFASSGSAAGASSASGAAAASSATVVKSANPRYAKEIEDEDEDEEAEKEDPPAPPTGVAMFNPGMQQRPMIYYGHYNAPKFIPLRYNYNGFPYGMN